MSTPLSASTCATMFQLMVSRSAWIIKRVDFRVLLNQSFSAARRARTSVPGPFTWRVFHRPWTAE
ncbi:MAG TPA: hypothetical protein VFP68_11215 [Burkholderiaceae bacterium]|nr:hypothetical protein [Burkholderiaceae bacterium]